MRKTKEELEQIKKENKVDTLWSWSRISSFDISHYEWYLKYICNKQGNRNDSIYGYLGNIAHDTLEKFYSNQIEYNDMIEEWDEGYFFANDIIQLKFNRNDSENNNKLSTNYNLNMRHFFQNHNIVHEDLKLEEFALINVDGNMLQGYIDAYYINNEDVYIIDYKTSSYFQKADFIHKSMQLILYGLWFVQNGTPIENIHCKFNFLKYCNITYLQKNGKYKTSRVERRQLAEKLQTPCKIWLKEYGYDIDNYLMKLIDTNGDLSVMPIEVQEKINIEDCYGDVPFTEETIKYTTDYIINTINEINNLTELYEASEDDSVWYDDEESVEKESYYYATLSEFGADLNPCYKRYLEKLESNKEGVIW